MTAQVGGMPGNNNNEIIEEDPNIIFRYGLKKYDERPDDDYVQTVQRYIDSLREVAKDNEVFRVELISDLLPLHNEGKWLLDLDIDNKGVIGLKDANITTYKMQMPISRVREIVIKKVK